MKTAVKYLTFFIALISIIQSCQKDKAKTAQMSIKMIDAPVDCDEVNVEVETIQVHYADGGGWINLATNSGVYDLLTLQDSVSAALVVNEEIPAGHLTQMRLILGDDNYVVVDSIDYPLLLSSQDETGLKLNLNAVVNPTDTVEVVFDFDAEQSIILQGNGAYRLKPVLKVASLVYL